MSAPRLAARDLRGGYGRQPILRGVTLAVAPGEVVGIGGRNGAGKTTLILHLAGLLPASGGVVELDGIGVTAMAAHRRARLGMGHVPQDRGVFPALKAREALSLPALLSPAARGDPAAAAIALLPALEPLMERPCGVLSGGEQQMLAIARALICRSRALLLDEPTEGLQPSLVTRVIGLLRDGARQGAGIVLVEQNAAILRRAADRLLVMQDGRLHPVT